MSRAGQARPVPTRSLLVRDIQILATLDPELGDIRNAAIYVEGNVIKWVGASCDIPKTHATAEETISLPDRVLIPGLVNTHHHMFQCLTRCLAQDEKLFNWLATCYGPWQHMTASGADIYISSKLAMLELIMSGCTCSSDHLYIYPNDVCLEDSIRAARDLGLRFHPTRGAMSMGKSKGGAAPDSTCEEEEFILKDMKRLIDKFHDVSRFSMLRMGLAPCAPFNVTQDLMKAAAKLARQHQGVRLHTHLAENEEDIDYARKTFNCRPGEYIKRVGWDKDDVRKLLDNGVKVGIGVDGTASNDAGHMLMEVRQAMLLQRVTGNGMPAREALKVGTQGGAKVLGRDDIGRIAPGMAADFVAWRTDGISFSGAQHDLVAALLFCTPGLGPVDLSVINGDIIVKDGQMLTCSVKEVINEHTKHSIALCSHVKEQ
ncbi:MAG: hydroxydechloroatrazine ethylaminohydrolase [Trebouxia sp. A1-2]|nr:MAG: hydroxydechloroatrazine ethylaminohydrolase [Trebouxia sp. A1-2]